SIEPERGCLPSSFTDGKTKSSSPAYIVSFRQAARQSSNNLGASTRLRLSFVFAPSWTLKWTKVCLIAISPRSHRIFRHFRPIANKSGLRYHLASLLSLSAAQLWSQHQ